MKNILLILMMLTLSVTTSAQSYTREGNKAYALAVLNFAKNSMIGSPKRIIL